MRHVGAFLHFRHLPVSGVSITLFLFNDTTKTFLGFFFLNFNSLLSASVMKLAWAWAFLSSLLGALASRVTISPNWPEFCLQHARSQTYSIILWRKPCHLRRNGSRSTSTRRTPLQLRTASGEWAQAAVHPSDLCSFILLCNHVPLLMFALLVLPQVHQCIGGFLCQLCLTH